MKYLPTLNYLQYANDFQTKTYICLRISNSIEMMENHTIGDLYCNVCNNLLSAPPILIDDSGKNICGRCESDVSAGFRLRNVWFEILARQLKFPCRFSREGCKVKKMFDKIKGHEEKCPYQILKCGVKTCHWSGIPTELIIHHNKYHKELIIENNSIERELVDDRGCFILATEGFYFLIDWSYCEFKFKFNVKNLHLSGLCCDITFNYSLSTLNLENAIEISGLVTLNNGAKLNAQNCEEDILTNTSSLLFSIHTSLSINALSKKTEALNKIVCSNCSFTMIPSILKCPAGHITCIECSNTNYDYCPVCNDNEINFSRVPDLEMLAASSLYRCKWKDCGEDFSIREIELHQRICIKRLYICLYCPAWKGLLNEITSHVAACRAQDYICPMLIDTNITIPAAIINNHEEYTLIAHKEQFDVFFDDCGATGIEVAVWNYGPPSLFGWYCYEVILHHSEQWNFPFNKQYIIKSKFRNRYTLKIPESDIAIFGERQLCRITVKINLLSDSEKIQNVAEHFKWLK